MMPTLCVKVCLLQGYLLNEDQQPGEEADSCETAERTTISCPGEASSLGTDIPGALTQLPR